MTPFICSCPVEGLSWLEALAPQRADVFLTPAMPGVPVSGLAGLWPESEWRLGPDGGLEELKRFCFGTPGPALGFLAYHAPGWSGQYALDVASGFPAGVFRKYRVLLAPSPDGSSLHVHSHDPALAYRAAGLVSRSASGVRGDAPSPAGEAGLPGYAGSGDAVWASEPGQTAYPAVSGSPGPTVPSLDRDGYRRAVRRALDHILDGDIYQINLSIRFDCPWPGLAPAGLFSRLIRRYPALFYALFDIGSHALVSTSPERFIQVSRGRVLSQPIKGTRRVTGPLAGDVRRLLSSTKEDAELSMIVDLIRNDLSPHCAYGSVAVRGHKSVFEVDGLLQMYSNVEGRLKEGSTCLDLLWDALPPGSVTGCPKRRAVEIIGELEPHRRDAYCGCLAVVHGPRDLDSSVAIRTAALDRSGEMLSFFAGSGIVVDSDPDLEYEETLAKAAKFLALTRRTRP